MLVTESTKTCPHYLMAATHVKQLLADRGGGQGELNSLPCASEHKTVAPPLLAFYGGFVAVATFFRPSAVVYFVPPPLPLLFCSV